MVETAGAFIKLSQLRLFSEYGGWRVAEELDVCYQSPSNSPVVGIGFSGTFNAMQHVG